MPIAVKTDVDGIALSSSVDGMSRGRREFILEVDASAWAAALASEA